MTRATHYIALLRKDADSDYGVDFPDFPGCATAGATLEEAMAMAAEALDLHTEDMKDLPVPTSLDEIMADPHNADAVAVMVATPVRRTRAVAVRITLDERLLSDVDRAARAAGESRSGFLASAARDRLHRNESGTRA